MGNLNSIANKLSLAYFSLLIYIGITLTEITDPVIFFNESRIFLPLFQVRMNLIVFAISVPILINSLFLLIVILYKNLDLKYDPTEADGHELTLMSIPSIVQNPILGRVFRLATNMVAFGLSIIVQIALMVRFADYQSIILTAAHFLSLVFSLTVVGYYYHSKSALHETTESEIDVDDQKEAEVETNTPNKSSEDGKSRDVESASQSRFERIRVFFSGLFQSLLNSSRAWLSWTIRVMRCVTYNIGRGLLFVFELPIMIGQFVFFQITGLIFGNLGKENRRYIFNCPMGFYRIGSIFSSIYICFFLLVMTDFVKFEKTIFMKVLPRIEIRNYSRADQTNPFPPRFENRSFRYLDFFRANIENIEFHNCDLFGSYFRNCTIPRSVFNSDELIMVSFLNCDLRKTHFEHDIVSHLLIKDTNFESSTFLSRNSSYLNFRKTHFNNSNLTFGSLFKSSVINCWLVNCYIESSIYCSEFRDTYFTNSTFYQGVWLDNLFYNVDLSFTDLKGTKVKLNYFKDIDAFGIRIGGGSFEGPIFRTSSVYLSNSSHWELAPHYYSILALPKIENFNDHILAHSGKVILKSILDPNLKDSLLCIDSIRNIGMHVIPLIHLKDSILNVYPEDQGDCIDRRNIILKVLENSNGVPKGVKIFN